MEKVNSSSGALVVWPGAIAQQAQPRADMQLCDWVVEQVSKGFVITVQVSGWWRCPLEGRALINALPACMRMVREVANRWNIVVLNATRDEVCREVGSLWNGFTEEEWEVALAE